MEEYNEKEVLYSAQRFYNSRARYGKNWEGVLDMARLWETNRIRHLEERNAKALELQKNYEPSADSDYNDKSIPESAFYNPDSKGLMGAHYIGD